jgi:hypothetical protein
MAKDGMFFIVAYSILGAFCLFMWPVSTVGRLAELGWNRSLVLAFAVPWVVFEFVMQWGSVPWRSAAIAVLIVSQLPLVLLPGRAGLARGAQQVAGGSIQ